MFLTLNQTQFSPSNSKKISHILPTSHANQLQQAIKWVTVVATFSHPLHLSPPQGVQLIGTKGDAAQLWSSKTYGILKRKHPGNPPGAGGNLNKKKRETWIYSPRKKWTAGNLEITESPPFAKGDVFWVPNLHISMVQHVRCFGGGVFQPPHLWGSQQDGGFRSRDHYKWSDQGAPKIMVL